MNTKRDGSEIFRRLAFEFATLNKIYKKINTRGMKNILRFSTFLNKTIGNLPSFRKEIIAINKNSYKFAYKNKLLLLKSLSKRREKYKIMQ